MFQKGFKIDILINMGINWILCVALLVVVHAIRYTYVNIFYKIAQRMNTHVLNGTCARWADADAVVATATMVAIIAAQFYAYRIEYMVTCSVPM